MSIQIITTGDGSHSLLNTELNETYHSVHGAMQESMHVFIENGLRYFLTTHAVSQLNILEIGFGTGLNALLALQEAATSGCEIFYTTIEAYPVAREVWSQLNYVDSSESNNAYQQLHQASFNTLVQITPNFRLLKLHNTLQHITLDEAHYDLIFFDAFAPNKQPDMWAFPMLQKVVDAMNDHAVFVTYCAKGQVKRDLRSAGLAVQSLAGPPGKKEMIRALKI